MLLTISCASAAEDLDDSSIATVDEQGDIQPAIDDASLEILNYDTDDDIISGHIYEGILPDSADEEVLSDSVEEKVLSDSADEEVLSDPADSDGIADPNFYFKVDVNEYGEPMITAHVDKFAVGEVSINITDSSDTVIISDLGQFENAEYVLGGPGFYLPKGVYKVYAHYYGDITFAPRDYFEYLTIEKDVVDLNVDYSVNNYGMIIINATLNKTATGNITFNIVPEGEDPNPYDEVTVAIEDGAASYNELTPFAKGNYTIYVTYNGDDNYYIADSEPIAVKVNKDLIVPKTENISVEHGFVTFVVDLGAPATGNVSITYPSGFIGYMNISDGKVSFYAPIENEYGNVSLVLDYEGDEYYYGFYDYYVDFFIKYDSNLTVNFDINKYGIVEVVAKVNETATGNITFNIMDFSDEIIFNGTEEIVNGSATYYELTQIELGYYQIQVEYSGDELFDDVTYPFIPFNIYKHYITPSTTYLNVTRDEVHATVDLGDDATGNVSVAYPDGSIHNLTIVDGKVEINDTFPTLKGDVSLVLDYDGDNNYFGFYEYFIDFFIKYDPNLNIQAKVNDYGIIDVTANVNNTATGIINVIIRNSTGNIVVEGTEPIVNGFALYYELAQYAKDTYTIEVVYSGDDHFNGAVETTSVEVTKLNPSMDYNVKVVGGEVTIAITMPSDINGKLKVLYPSGYVENVSIKNGSARIYNVFMRETGDLAITATFEGNDQYYAVESIIGFVIKQATEVKTSSSIAVVYKNNAKVTVKLTNLVTKKAIASAPIQITVNGKTYKGKTNKNGNVVISIPANMLPKKYNARVVYKGTDRLESDSFNFKLTVKKANPKLTAKSKTFKKSVKVKKYAVTLKDHKGKVIKKAKLTIQVGKKKFTATTNAKGKAVFKLTKLSKKAKYTAKITYNGNKYFNKINKKVKIVSK